MGPPSFAGALGSALTLFRAGDLAGARAGVDAVLAGDPRNVAALHLAGEIAARAGDLDLASSRLVAAAAIAPGAEVLSSLARLRWRQGDIEAAAALARDGLAARPGFAPTLLVAAFCDHAGGNADGFRRALSLAGLPDADPMGVELAFQAIAENVRDGRRVFADEAATREARTPLSVTVVTCSIDDAKLARCRAALRASLSPGYEHLEFRAPPSLARAYNRALAVARGEAIVFVHDDVEILTPDLGAVLSRTLARADIAGVVGTRSLTGPTLGWSGQREMRGWLVHGGSAESAWDFSLTALRAGLQAGMQGLDGCFIAARASSARAIGFDEASFDAFHFYDLDFCLRAHRAGLAVAVDSAILIAHASRGRLGPDWEAQERRFAAKFSPIGATPANPSHFHAVRLASAADARRLHAELEGFCAALGSHESRASPEAGGPLSSTTFPSGSAT